MKEAVLKFLKVTHLNVYFTKTNSNQNLNPLNQPLLFFFFFNMKNIKSLPCGAKFN